MTASPIPSSVPDSPTWSARVVPWAMCPKSLATSPRAATSPNWPNPAAKAASATPTTERSVQAWSRRASTAPLVGSDRLSVVMASDPG